MTDLIPIDPNQPIRVKRRRTGQKLKLDEKKKAKVVIIEVMKNTANARAAAMAAGVGLSTLYRWVQEDKKFKAAFDEANQEADLLLFAEGWRRATIGDPEYVVSAGKLVYGPDGQPLTQMRKSDSLLSLYLKSRMPKIFGDKADINLNVMPKQYFSDADLEGTED